MIRIDVGASAGREYPILISDGLLARLPESLDELAVGRRRLVVSTPPIWSLVEADAQRVAPGVAPLLMPDGERFKLLSTVARLYDGFVGASADRGSVVVAIGGGVVGDTAGFAAATFLRGLPVVHVPTTLLAQVDSAIGGKVGVNLAAGKNLVGAFHPPVAVLIDPGVLGSLPRREFRSGLYEVVKYAMIASPALFERLTRDLPAVFAREPSVVEPVIAECCRDQGARGHRGRARARPAKNPQLRTHRRACPGSAHEVPTLPPRRGRRLRHARGRPPGRGPHRPFSG